MLDRFLNNFFTPKLAKNYPTRSNFFYKNLDFQVICQHVKLKINPKVGLISPKTMLKQQLTKSMTTSKKFRKLSIVNPQNDQNVSMWPKKLSLSLRNSF